MIIENTIQEPVQAGFIINLILTVVLFVVGELLKPKPEKERARPSGLGDFQFPTATEGRVIPIGWGTYKINGPNVLWYGDLTQVPITQTVKQNMFNKKRVTVGFRYSVGIQFGLGRGPITALTGIWVGDDKVFSGSTTTFVDIFETALFGGDKYGNGGVLGRLRIHLGTETQTADSYLSQFQQEGGDTPAYRGTAYAVWDKSVVLSGHTVGGYVGNSTDIKTFAFEIVRIPNGLGLITAEAQLNSGADANPMNILYELITNDEWGLGFLDSDVDTANFTTVAGILATENNGMSLSLEQEIDALEFLREIERQIDGVIFIDRSTGKFKVNLIREGQASVGTLDETNVVSVRDFSRQSWNDTANQVRVKFSDRSRNYFETYALAQDMANKQIVGANINADVIYPGVKDPDLANEIAWRELRTLNRPLAKCTLVVNREFWDINVGDPVVWSDATLGITNLGMRVLKATFGDLVKGEITLNLVEDIFTSDAASFAKPQPTGWVKPVDVMEDVPAADRIVFEAPKAISDRDPDLPGVRRRLWSGVRSQGNSEVGYDIAVDGNIEGTTFGFLLVGELNAAITRDSTGPIVLNSNVDSAAAMEGFFTNVTDTDKGVSLAQMVLINNEFIFIDSASESGGLLTMTGPTRGVLDTVPAEHTAGDLCYLMFVSGNVTDGTFDAATVSVEILPESPTDKLTLAEATAFNVSLDDRDLKPYPPSRPRIAGVEFNGSSVSLDTAVGASDDGDGFTVDFIRRDYRTTDEFLAQQDEATLPSDFPSANTTEYRVEVINDPDGSPTSLFTTDWATGDGTAFAISRTEILANNSANVPSKLRIEVQTRHTVDATVYEADQVLQWDFDTDSAELDGGDTNLGVVGNGVSTAAYTVVTTGNHTLRIGSDILVNGTLQENVNSGGFVNTGIAAGTTSVTRSYTNTDSVIFRINGETPAINLNTLFTVDDVATGDISEAHGVFTL